MSLFAEILDKIEELSLEERLELNDIIQKRINEKKREELIKTVLASRREFKEGKFKNSSVDEIIKEVIS